MKVIILKCWTCDKQFELAWIADKKGYININRRWCAKCGSEIDIWVEDTDTGYSPCEPKEAVCVICNGTGMVLEPRKDSPGCDWEPCPGCNKD